MIWVIIWLAAAALLYFFENNTGTRAVFILSVLFALIPGIRQAVLTPRSPSGRKTGRHSSPSNTSIHRFCVNREEGADPRGGKMERDPLFDGNIPSDETEPGIGVRPYVPGDPIARIHWKLSARRDELLSREEESGRTEGEIPSESRALGRINGRLVLLCFAIPAAAACLFFIPGLRHSLYALLNLLFEASERANAYLYQHFPVPAGQSPLAAAAVLCWGLSGPAAAMVLTRSRLMALGGMLSLAAFQVWFGLSLPSAVNVILFLMFVFWCMGDAAEVRKNAHSLALSFLVCFLAAAVLFPGVDAATEAASERVRDFFGGAVQPDMGDAAFLPEAVTETRHTHSLSLREGDGEARPGREYRSLSTEEEQISDPHRLDLLRIILLLLLTAAVPALPFLPFLIVNARRKRSREAEALFDSGDIAEALRAIFGRVIAWLDASGFGQGNLPCREWQDGLSQSLSPEYARKFARCAEAYEEALYSARVPGEEKRQEALELLRETRELLQGRADRGLRFRLRYIDCLWI